MGAVTASLMERNRRMIDRKEGLWYRCRDFITDQSAGEWDEKTIADDADKLFAFVTAEITLSPTNAPSDNQ